MKGTLRITPQEDRMLTDAFGSTGRALRQFVDSYKAGWLERPPTPPVFAAEVGASVPAMSDEQMFDALAHETVAHPMLDDAAVVAMVPVDEALDDVALTRAAADAAVIEADLPMRTAHRHRPHVKVATEFDHGTKVEIWKCECGAELRR